MGKLSWTPHDYYTTKYAWDQFIGHIMGGLHLQHTLIAVPFTFWKFFIVIEPKKKIPIGKCDSYGRMLQMNPPYI